MRYSPERKEAVLKKMLPPQSVALSELAREEGISEATPYNGQKEARARGRLLPDGEPGTGRLDVAGNARSGGGGSCAE